MKLLNSNIARSGLRLTLAISCSVCSQAAFAQNAPANSVEEYLRCMREAGKSLKQCLADIAGAEADKDSRYAACIQQANQIEQTERAACQSQFANKPAELANCIQSAAANGNQIRQGCETQKARDEANIKAKKLNCQFDQARKRRICALLLPQTAPAGAGDKSGDKAGSLSSAAGEFVSSSELTLEELQDLVSVDIELVDPEFVEIE
ncbi:MAG: hypothetical protein K1X79_04880 [Oligoflexia bacterium]|nr:hypothetical protein [Oligoflexia bacterium]